MRNKWYVKNNRVRTFEKIEFLDDDMHNIIKTKTISHISLIYPIR